MTLTPFEMDSAYLGTDARTSPPVVGVPYGSSLDEPTEVCTFGEDGYVKTRRPAPILKCYTCGKPTTRSIPTVVHLDDVVRNEMQWRMEMAAECSRCGTALAIRTLQARQLNPELSEKVRAEEAVLLAEMEANQ